jgi:Mg/Co/Ni transporter MgtE
VANKVFAAQLAGIWVFGPDGESIGRVRDLVAGLRTDQAPPRVLGLIVELSTRRRIFVPMLRVTSVEAAAVTLSTGSVNLRRFAQRPNEILVIGQMLRRRVTVEGEGSATLVDVGMEQQRTRDWLITKLAVQQRSGLLSRRTPVTVLDWDQVDGLDPVVLSGGVPNVLAMFDDLRAIRAANALLGLPIDRQYEVIDALDDERVADILEELPQDDQTRLLTHLDEERAADVLEVMNPDDAADLLAGLPEPDKNRLLELMEPEESAPLRRLLSYSWDTAGGLMTPEPVVLLPDVTIAEALARVRNPDITPALASMVFVCRPPSATPTGRYLGLLHLQRLLREPPADLVAGAVDTDLDTLSPDADLAAVTRYFAAYNLVCAPVVDDDGHLLGAITVDDVLDHLLPPDWRMMGLRQVGAARGSVASGPAGDRG